MADEKDNEVVGRLRVKTTREELRSAQSDAIDPRQLQMLLEGLQRKPGRTFGELAAEWHQLRAKTLVEPRNEWRHLQHLGELHGLTEADLLPRVVEHTLSSLLKENGGKLSRSTVNKVRGTGLQVIASAIANREWHHANPFELTRRFQNRKKVGQSLTLDEARAMLRHLRRDRWRECVFALWLGPRAGEIKALKKEDVDLPGRRITIRRSNGRDSTKTGFNRELPIPEGLVPVLDEAMRVSVSGLVFPDRCGRLQRFDSKWTKMLRTALRAAGVNRPTFRYQDLRHSAMTLLLEVGCLPLAAKVVLGWSRKNTGDDTYAHLTHAFMKREVEKLNLIEPGRHPKSETKELDGRGFGPHSRRRSTAVDASERPTEAIMSQSKPSESGGFGSGGASLGSLCSTPELPPRTSDDVLTLQESARYLKVSRFTFSKIRDSGYIPFANVLGAQRFRRADLDEFLKRGGTKSPPTSPPETFQP